MEPATPARPAALIGVFTLAAGAFLMAHTQAPEPAYVPWIERLAPAAFDTGAPPLVRLEGRYRIDARVWLPLGLTSLKLWSRQDVGTAVFTQRDIRADGKSVVRTWELLATSNPARAHGIDRRGFFREATLSTPEGVDWTAYLGAMTTWAERSLSDVRRSMNAPQPATFEAIDGLTSPLEARAAVFRVVPDRPATDPAGLWSALRSKLATHRPRYQHVVSGSQTAPLPTLAFFGALEASLVSAARHRDRPLKPAQTRVSFMHNEVVRVLELKSIERAPGPGRTFARTGLVGGPDDVFGLRYRIITTGGGEANFNVWAELPPTAADGLIASPIIPLGADMQLRSYLTLEFRRTR